MSTEHRTPIGRVVSPVLVGRDGELRRLVAAVAAAPAVVVVEGEAGIGKSRLVAELARQPELASRRFLTGGCERIRRPFPLGPVVDALRGVGDVLAGASLTPVAGALRHLLPELTGVLPPTPEALDDREAQRHRVYRGLVEVLAAVGPAVLVVEDLHWADEQTVEFLTYLLAGPPGELSLAVTYRGAETDASVRAVTARAGDAVTYEHVPLLPLDVEQTRLLAGVLLDETEVSLAFAMHLCERASGLPLAVQELVALLRARGGLIRWEGGWARRTIEELDVPRGVRDSVQERVARLPDAARGVAEAAAVLQTAVPVRVLLEVAAAESPEAVDDLLVSGLLGEGDGSVGFRHVLSAQAVYEGLPLARRQALHARAAEAVRGLRPEPLAQVAHHLREAGRVAQWMEASVAAAEQAQRLGDDAQAARLWEEVLRHARLEPLRRAEMTIRLGWAITEAIQVPDAVDLISEALAHELPREVRGELRFLLCASLDVAGLQPMRRHQLFKESAEDLEDRPDLSVWAMMAMGLPTTAEVPFAEHMMWLERALHSLPDVVNLTRRLFLLGKIAMAFTVIGDPRWSPLTERLLAETGGRAERRQVNSAYRTLGEAACYGGHHETGRRLVELALESAAGCDVSGVAEYRGQSVLAVVDYCHGSWDGLAERVHRLREVHNDRTQERVTVDIVAACLAITPGTLEAVHERLWGVIREALDVCDLDLLPLAVTALLRVAVAREQAETGLAQTAEVVAVWESKCLWPVAVRAVPALVAALLAAGRDAEAAALVLRYEQGLRGRDAPLAAPALAHAHGVLAAAGRRWAEAAECFTAAGDGYRALPAAYEAAQAEEQAAACLLAAGDDAAEPRLLGALAAYERLDARWDLDRTMRLARRHGLRPAGSRHREEPPTAEALTARQRQVARLAATGLTNQEIARELFLSAKTVEKHLAAALQRLGLRSRIDLGRVEDLSGG